MAETALALAQKAARLFAERDFENARLEAELLLAHVLGIGRLELYTQFDRPVRAEELERFRACVRRRLRHEPLQYILGDVQFRTLRLHVDRRALIPRPETELLVGAVLEHLQRAAVGRAQTDGPASAQTDGPTGEQASGPAGEQTDKRAGGPAGAPAGAKILDLGTGTGAIALALLVEGEAGAAVATDISLDALALARENAESLGVAQRIELRHGDLWGCIASDERFDVVVSNPPYVDEADAPGLAPEVREWEPASALFAPGGGMAVLERIVDGARAHLVEGGLLALELGIDQAERVAARIATLDAFEAPRIMNDLTGRPRIVRAVARRNGSGSEHE